MFSFNFFKKDNDKNVNGKIEFYDENGKTVKSVAKNNIAKIKWKDYGPCCDLPVKLNSDGTIQLYCTCSRVYECSKPYGYWKWRRK